MTCFAPRRPSAPPGRTSRFWHRFYAYCLLLAGAALLAAPAPSRAENEVVIRDTARIQTLGIDSKDYENIVEQIASDLLIRPELNVLTNGVLGLGPIDNNDCPFPFQAYDFQNTLATRLQRSGKLVFSEVINNLNAESASAAAIQVKYFDFLRHDPSAAPDPELTAVAGDLASVQFLLFGRLSSQTQVSDRGDTIEVTYRYSWKVMDVKRGVWIWSEIVKLVKSAPCNAQTRLPWWDALRGDSPVYYFSPLQYRKAGEDLKLAEQAATANAQADLLKRVNQKLAATDPNLIPPLYPAELPVELTPEFRFLARGESHTNFWLFRTPRQPAEKLVHDRLEIWTNYQACELHINAANQIPAASARRTALKQCLHELDSFAARYPLNSQPIFHTEALLFQEADLWTSMGFPGRAQPILETIAKQSAFPDWVNQARNRLATLAIDPTNEALRFALEDHSLAIVAVHAADGRTNLWPELQAKVQAQLKIYGASNIVVALPPAQAVKMTLDQSGLEPGADHKIPDWLFILCADGATVKADPDVDGGIYSFQGELRWVILKKGKFLAADAKADLLFPQTPLQQWIWDVPAKEIAKRYLECFVRNLDFDEKP